MQRRAKLRVFACCGNHGTLIAAATLHRGLTGSLVDGPVYASIFRNLRGVSLHDADEYARFNTGSIVYHDDPGDYETNEHIMDGTASLAYLLSTLDRAVKQRHE